MRSIILLLLAIGMTLACTAQTHVYKDSLEREITATSRIVDSLRHRADKQDTIRESMKRMVDILSAAKGPDTSELAGWRRNYTAWMAGFDSTLVRLDSFLGVLNKLKEKADAQQAAEDKKKRQKLPGN